jgi:predicted SprT family Zn-dependent metalloprotease
MKIARGNLSVKPEFYEKVCASVRATHERLIKADLATPEVREYLNGCRVVLSSRMVTSAGIAKLRKHCIHLNVRLLALHPDMLPETVAHEVGHLLAARLYGERGHGEHWKQLMVALGFEPRSCHNFKQEGPGSQSGSLEPGS